MSNVDVIRAWKDEEYRESLTEDEKALLPLSPAGPIELEDAELDGATGGQLATKTIVVKRTIFVNQCVPKTIAAAACPHVTQVLAGCPKVTLVGCPKLTAVTCPRVTLACPVQSIACGPGGGGPLKQF